MSLPLPLCLFLAYSNLSFFVMLFPLFRFSLGNERKCLPLASCSSETLLFSSCHTSPPYRILLVFFSMRAAYTKWPFLVYLLFFALSHVVFLFILLHGRTMRFFCYLFILLACYSFFVFAVSQISSFQPRRGRTTFGMKTIPS